MKSFAIIHNYKQWKVSYGEHKYWKLGSAWYKYSEDHKTLMLVEGDERKEIEELWFKKIQTW